MADLTPENRGESAEYQETRRLVVEHHERMASLAGDLKDYLETQNQTGNLPPVAWKLFFSSHTSPQDLDGIEPLLEESDALFAEREGWNEAQRQVYNEISKGAPIPVGSKTIVAMDRAILSKVHNTGLPVYFIDVPLGHPADDKFRKILKEFRPALGMSGGLEAAMARTKDVMRRFALINNEREEYMLSQLKPQMERLVTDHPDLKNKEKLTITNYAGASHTGIYHPLKQAGLNAEHRLSPPSFTYGIFEEANRNIQRGNVIELDDDTTIKVMFNLFLSDKLFGRLYEKTKFDRKIQDFLRIVEEEFTVMEMIEVLKTPANAIGKKFTQCLVGKGIRIPYSAEKLDEFLAQRRKK